MRNGAANNHPARFWSFGAWSPDTESAVLSTLRAGRATALVVVISASRSGGMGSHGGPGGGELLEAVVHRLDTGLGAGASGDHARDHRAHGGLEVRAGPGVPGRWVVDRGERSVGVVALGLELLELPALLHREPGRDVTAV